MRRNMLQVRIEPDIPAHTRAKRLVNRNATQDFSSLWDCGQGYSPLALANATSKAVTAS
jgi:hypothetical protein